MSEKLVRTPQGNMPESLLMEVPKGYAAGYNEYGDMACQHMESGEWKDPPKVSEMGRDWERKMDSKNIMARKFDRFRDKTANLKEI